MTVRPHVVAVSRAPAHRFSKAAAPSITLIAGHGVAGDAHCGERVQNRYLRRRNAQASNLRQVHLLPAELIDALSRAGFELSPGELGENITTSGLDLQGLAMGACLRLGGDAVVEVTGLRDPCRQMDRLRPGLMAATRFRDDAGRLVRRAGIMGVVRNTGDVRPGDAIVVEPPPAPHRPLPVL